MPKKSTSRRKLTRKERQDLDIEISFLAGIVQRDPNYLEALQVLGDDYTRRGKFAKGLEIDEHLAKLRPEDPTVHYNLACSYALTDSLEDAAAALHRSIDLGYRDFRWLSRDPDLADLRKSQHYKKIRAKIKSVQVQSD